MKKRKTVKLIIRALFSLLVLAFAAVIVVAAVRSRDDLTVSNVISNITSMWSRSGGAEEYEYEKCAAALRLSGGIATVSENGIRTLDEDGDEALLNSFTMRDPALETSGGTALAYDIGGNILKTFSLDAVKTVLETKGAIISASLGEDGWYAVCTEESGYTTSVTVYNDKGTAVYQWYSGEGYILTAKLGPGNKTMAAVALTDGGSDIVWLRLDSEDETGRFSLPDKVIIDIALSSGDTAAALTNEGLLFVDNGGKTLGEYDFSDRYLANYSLGDGSQVLLALTGGRLEKTGQLVLVKQDGTEAATAPISETVTAASGGSGGFAVLYEGTAAIYDGKLQELKSFQVEQGMDIGLESGQTALVTGEYSAKLYGRE